MCTILLDRLVTSRSLPHSLSLARARARALSLSRSLASLSRHRLSVHLRFIFDPLCQVYDSVLISRSRVSRRLCLLLPLSVALAYFSLSVSLSLSLSPRRSVFLLLYLSPFVSRSSSVYSASCLSLSLSPSLAHRLYSMPFSPSRSLSFSVSEVFIDVP